ncbi:hypothetical protein QWI18_01000 [Pseudomonas sp. W2Oct36]|jgi:hypothetical protein
MPLQLTYYEKALELSESQGAYLTDIPLHAVKTQQDAEGLSDALDR